jgi:hypothetical protein
MIEKEQRSTFIKGKMNKSVDERLLPTGEYVEAINARLGSTEESEIGSLENSKGNEKLTTIIDPSTGSALSAQAVCIGAYSDINNNKIYFFVHDPVGTNLNMIVSYDILLSITTYHLVSKSVLKFNPKYLITGIVLVDDLLFWTDDLNPPRRINVNTSYGLPTGSVDAFTEESINVIVEPPLYAPTLELQTVDNNTKSYLTDEFVCFSYRYKYEDGEYSALSPFSLPAFDPESVAGELEIDFATLKNESMVNSYNAVTVFFNTGSSLVKEIEVCFKETNNSVIKVIDRYNKSELGWGDNITQSTFFREKEIFRVLSENQNKRLYDNVPLKAKALTFAANRIVYGNYVDGYNLISQDGLPVRLDFETSLASNASFSNNDTLIEATIESSDYTVKSGAGTATASVDLSKMVFDFNNAVFTQGERVSLIINLISKSGATNKFNQTAGTLAISRSSDFSIGISRSVILTNSYANLTAFQASDDFKRLFGIGLNSASSFFESFTASATGRTAVDMLNSDVISSPCTDTVTSSNATPVNSAAQYTTSNPSNCLVTPAAPNYPTGQGGFECPAPLPASLTVLNIQVPMVVYNTGGDAGTYSYEGFEVQNAQIAISSGIGVPSLHSNRDYDIGMVYMDKYGRSTPALVSLNGSMNVAAGRNSQRNAAQVEIPISQKPPSWATNFRFAIKPSKQPEYDTLYFLRAYKVTNREQYWLLLEGETIQKVEEGNVYVVKADINGAKTTYVEATCLKKSSDITAITAEVTAGTIPVGTYAQFEPDGKYVVDDPNIFNEKKVARASQSIGFSGNNSCIQAAIDLTTFTQTTIPQGTTVQIEAIFERDAGSWPVYGADEYGAKHTTLFIQEQASQDYSAGTLAANLQSFIETDVLNMGGGTVFPFSPNFIDSSDNEGSDFGVTYVPALGVVQDAKTCFTSASDEEHGIGFNGNNFGIVSGFRAVFPPGKTSCTLKVKLSNTPDGLVVMETKGENTPDEIYYEGSQTFNISNQLHKGNLQDQNTWSFYDNAQNNAYRAAQGLPASSAYGGNLALTTTGGSGDDAPFAIGDTVNVQQTNLAPANPQYNGVHTIVEKPDSDTIVLDVAFGVATGVEGGTVTASALILTDFFNCFMWGNGVESSRIKDSIKENYLSSGERVYNVDEQEYKQLRRESSLTYSGTYNEVSKINKLNEFNLGILNFKDLTQEFGGVQYLFSRKSDILVLQEDKISYVLVGKDLLSSADGGGNISSVPTVLGKQIARLEEYGISTNPESFAQYGRDKYFTDAKRGAVILLRGADQNEELIVASQYGMRGFFRDLFIAKPKTQKLGGFDPYMNEYILSSNSILLPSAVTPVSSPWEVEGNSVSAAADWSVNLGTATGSVSFDYAVTSGSIVMDVTYNGVSYTSGVVSGSGSVTFSKDSPIVNQASVTITPSGGAATYSATFNSPTVQSFNVVQICVYDPAAYGGQLIHNEFLWENKTEGVSSPLFSEQITLPVFGAVDPLKTYNAQYQIYNSPVGLNTSPTNNSIVTIRSNKQGADTFTFTPGSSRLLYLISNTAFANSSSGMNALLAAATNLVVSNPSKGLYTGEFTYTNPTPATNNYLYLIYDYIN